MQLQQSLMGKVLLHALVTKTQLSLIATTVTNLCVCVYGVWTYSCLAAAGICFITG